MKQLTIYTLILVLAVIVSGCGAQAVPTVNAVDVQRTAEAAAFTMVAQTQAAIPTATPLPPTETSTNTPPPTATPLAVLTLQSTLPATVAPTSSAGGDPCATRILGGSPKGKETIIRIANLTKAAINISLYLNETAGAGECGYRSYTLSKQADVIITDLVQGCYNLWAWSQDGQKVRVNASGFGCINNPDKWTFEISEGSIKFTQ